MQRWLIVIQLHHERSFGLRPLAVVARLPASIWMTVLRCWIEWIPEVLLCDVNVLVYAHRRDADQHLSFKRWMESLVNGEEAFGMSSVVLSGFLRVVTHPKVFASPSRLEDAMAFANALIEAPNCVPVAPGARHWGIFCRLCEQAGVRGNLVPDAWLAALAIESGCEWITTDRDFSRFEGLRNRHPLR